MKKRVRSILASGVLLILGFVVEIFADNYLSLTGEALPFLPLEVVSAGLFFLSFAAAGISVFVSAVRNISRGQVFDENFLMAAATIGAVAIGEYPEAAAVMLFYQIGEYFQSKAVRRSRKSIADLMDIRPESANVLRGGEEITLPPEEVAVGETIIIKPGEKIPLDGTVLTGTSQLDTKALTGESVPRGTSPGEAVLSGCINFSGVLTVEVAKPYGESAVAKILDLAENAGNKKAKSENFITRFAEVYTPIVVFAAIALAIIPPLAVNGEEFTTWIYRA